MITIAIIILYIGNVFLNRYLNSLLPSKKYNKSAALWFLSLLCTIPLIIIVLNEKSTDVKWINWFVGKHWEDEKEEK